MPMLDALVMELVPWTAFPLGAYVRKLYQVFH